MAPTLFHKFLAELLGTYLLVLLGCGAVHASVLSGTPIGLAEIAVVWGFAIITITAVCGGISGAHLNPAVTLSMAMWGRFRGSHLVSYFMAQFIGAFLAAATLHTLYGGLLLLKDAQVQTLRGQPGSIVTASCYGQYYPNPSVGVPGGEGNILNAAGQAVKIDVVSTPVAFLAELIGTAVLTLVIFAASDRKNHHAPPAWMSPVIVGVALAALIVVIGPLTQGSFNPARDFSPRLFAFLAGWRDVAMPGPNGVGYITVYIFAPFLGAIVGGGFYEAIFRPLLMVRPRDMEQEMLSRSSALDDDDE